MTRRSRRMSGRTTRGKNRTPDGNGRDHVCGSLRDQNRPTARFLVNRPGHDFCCTHPMFDVSTLVNSRFVHLADDLCSEDRHSSETRKTLVLFLACYDAINAPRCTLLIPDIFGKLYIRQEPHTFLRPLRDRARSGFFVSHSDRKATIIRNFLNLNTERPRRFFQQILRKSAASRLKQPPPEMAHSGFLRKIPHVWKGSPPNDTRSRLYHHQTHLPSCTFQNRCYPCAIQLYSVISDNATAPVMTSPDMPVLASVPRETPERCETALCSQESLHSRNHEP